MLEVTGFWAGVLGGWLLGQSVLVMLLRRRFGVAIGAGKGEKPLLERAMRAQANTAEYVPMILILLGLVELQGGHVGVLWGLGLVVLLGRVCHALALVWSEPRSLKLGLNLRVVGMACTWTVLGVLSGWCLVLGIG